MNIVVFGANRPTGRLGIGQALSQGHAVMAFTRHPETFPVRDERLRVMRGTCLSSPRSTRRWPGRMPSPAVTRYQMAERHLPGRFTSRADLADCMLQQLASDQYLRKAVAMATSSGQPSLLAFLWREGIRKKT